MQQLNGIADVRKQLTAKYAIVGAIKLVWAITCALLRLH